MRAGWEMFLPSPLASSNRARERGWRAHRRWILHHWRRRSHRASRLRLDLVGLSRDPVHVRAIRARVVSRDENRRPGVAITSPSAGEVAIIPCVIDLDDDEPVGRRVDSTEEFGGPFFDDYATGDPLLLTVEHGGLRRCPSGSSPVPGRPPTSGSTLDLVVRGEPMTMPVPRKPAPSRQRNGRTSTRATPGDGSSSRTCWAHPTKSMRSGAGRRSSTGSGGRRGCSPGAPGGFTGQEGPCGGSGSGRTLRRGVVRSVGQEALAAQGSVTGRDPDAVPDSR